VKPAGYVRAGMRAPAIESHPQYDHPLGAIRQRGKAALELPHSRAEAAFLPLVPDLPNSLCLR